MTMDRTIESTGQDWANHLSHEVSGNGLICLVATLSCAPDTTVLQQAVEDMVALQPVLMCRFDETREPPVWTPLKNGTYFQTVQANSLREGIDLVTQNVSTPEQVIKATLVCAPDQPALCLCFDHAATDAGGAVRCLALLARCYQQRLEGREPDETVCADRSDGAIYSRCGLSDFRMALKRGAPASERVMTVPYGCVDGRLPQYRWVSLSLSAAKRPNSTLNDRLLAAYALALSKTNDEGRRASIHMTIDLRRYLTNEATPLAANLSGMEAVDLTIGPQTPFADTLAQVKTHTEQLKAGHIGLSSAAMMTYLRTMPYASVKAALLEAGKKSRHSGAAAPILSNLGQTFSQGLAFGDSRVTNLLPLLPVLHAPAFMLGACGYGDTLTISAGVYAEERSAEDTDRFLRRISRFLMDEPA